MDSRVGGHLSEVALPAATCEIERPEFRDLYESHFDFVWRTVRRLGVGDSGVDDAVQDVFIVVHRRLDDFEGRSSMRSWIFGIARRVAKDYRRRASRKDRGKVPIDGLADNREPGPGERAARSQAVALLYRLLEALDEPKREVFVLAELEAMTVPEIAAAIGVNPNTVYSRLRAARQLFERQVARHRAREERSG